MNTQISRDVLSLMAQGLAWEAHEALEEVWSSLAAGPERHSYHALIQVCASVHKSRQALQGQRSPERLAVGMQRLLRTAAAHLDAASKDPTPGWQAAGGLNALRDALACLRTLHLCWTHGAPTDLIDAEACKTLKELAVELGYRDEYMD